VIHHNLGRALAATGRLDEAIAHLETAVKGSPDNADFQQTLGQALMAKGRLTEALPHFETVSKINPGLADAHEFLGVCLCFARGDTAAALAEWREALRLTPDSVRVLNRTARVLAVSPDNSLRNGAEAVELARRAAGISKGNDPVVLDTLAAAQAEQGSFGEAVETARRALDLAIRQNNEPLAGRLREAISGYEARQPWRESPQ
jgi:tetratricopeptide (TPR) repeat protein